MKIAVTSQNFRTITPHALALFTDVFTAVLICLIPTMSVNLTVIWQGGIKQLKNSRHYLSVVPFVLLGTVIGSFLLLWLDPRPFLLLLAVAILLYLNQHRLQGLDFHWVTDHPILAYAMFGLTAGLMAGTVNVMLPVLIILLSNSHSQEALETIDWWRDRTDPHRTGGSSPGRYWARYGDLL
ncbi:MAG: hypothetical protein AAES65_00845 [Candidatus Thiodiazotropha sp. (ex. Lucinoma kazani)]